MWLRSLTEPIQMLGDSKENILNNVFCVNGLNVVLATPMDDQRSVNANELAPGNFLTTPRVAKQS
jgi:hypothetical protein